MARRRILIVDDDPDFVEYLRATLSSDYEVFTAEHGQNGLLQAIWKKPDLILMDMKMPRMTGLQVSKALKEAPDTRDIPVILLSSAKFDVETLRLLRQDIKVRAFLRKPCEPQALKKEVEKVFSPPPGAP